MEQLASFMGHTLGIHRSSYRLPDNLYQTAKISKLLILMEQGQAAQFKGKNLNDINLNLEDDLVENDENKNDQDGMRQEVNSDVETFESDEMTDKNKNRTDIDTEVKISKGKKRCLVPWSEQQKTVVTNFFKNHIKIKKPPKKAECESVKSQYPDLLNNKDWLKIKVFVQNKYTKSY